MVEEDAARGRLLERHDHAQERGLAGARPADDDGGFGLLADERDALDDLLLAKALFDVAQDDHLVVLGFAFVPLLHRSRLVYTGARMNQEEFELVTKGFKTKDSGGFAALPEGAQLTFYLAHGGASLSVSKVDAYKSDGPLLVLRTAKKESFHVLLADVYAIAAEGGGVGGAPAQKRVGFGA